MEYLKDMVRWAAGSEQSRDVLTDPQTSGGLLVAIPAARTADYLSRVEGAVEIGEVIEHGDVAIEVS